MNEKEGSVFQVAEEIKAGRGPKEVGRPALQFATTLAGKENYRLLKMEVRGPVTRGSGDLTLGLRKKRKSLGSQ